ncbi:MAG: hypothetical protein J6Y19_08470, partial [Kiritimatiellae bacterium]|nr:hypothetical protein [Kiritimatiellia bacterium]
SFSIALSAFSASGTASFDSGIFTYTPVPADIGLQTFTFIAQNPYGADTNDFTVEVLPAPEPPIPPAFAPWLSIPSVTIGDTLSTNISVSTAPNVYLSTAPAIGPAAVDFDTGLFSYTPIDTDVGNQIFTFVAANQYAVVTNDYSVEVLAPPTPPDPFAEWLASRGLSPDDYPADADHDSDGATNWEEFVADTDPDNPASVFALSFTTISSVSNIAVWTFPASTSRYYNLLTSTNLLDFATNYLGRCVKDATFTNELLPYFFIGLQSLLEPPSDSSSD